LDTQIGTTSCRADSQQERVQISFQGDGEEAFEEF
jgi:hypothetical protein